MPIFIANFFAIICICSFHEQHINLFLNPETSSSFVFHFLMKSCALSCGFPCCYQIDQSCWADFSFFHCCLYLCLFLHLAVHLLKLLVIIWFARCLVHLFIDLSGQLPVCLCIHPFFSSFHPYFHPPTVFIYLYFHPLMVLIHPYFSHPCIHPILTHLYLILTYFHPSVLYSYSSFLSYLHSAVCPLIYC